MAEQRDAERNLLTLTEAARMLGTSRPTVGRLVARGELPGFRSTLNRRATFVRVDDLRALQDRALAPIGGTQDRRME